MPAFFEMMIYDVPLRTDGIPLFGLGTDSVEPVVPAGRSLGAHGLVFLERLDAVVLPADDQQTVAGSLEERRGIEIRLEVLAKAGIYLRDERPEGGDVGRTPGYS